MWCGVLRKLGMRSVQEVSEYRTTCPRLLGLFDFSVPESVKNEKLDVSDWTVALDENEDNESDDDDDDDEEEDEDESDE
jgi:hypothetical protein